MLVVLLLKIHRVYGYGKTIINQMGYIAVIIGIRRCNCAEIRCKGDKRQTPKNENFY